MKKIVISLIIILSAISANAQTSTAGRILRNARRNAEWQIEWTINNEINRAINEATYNAHKERQAKKQSRFWECPCCHSRNKGNFCPHCGRQKPVELTPWECPNCHRHNDGGSYCETCGHARFADNAEKKTVTISVDELSSLCNK